MSKMRWQHLLHCQAQHAYVWYSISIQHIVIHEGYCQHGHIMLSLWLWSGSLGVSVDVFLWNGSQPAQSFFVCLCHWLYFICFFNYYFFFLHLLQRAHLLDNTEKLERSSRRLQAGYQIAVETGTYSVLDWVKMAWCVCVGGVFMIVVRMSERQQIVLLTCEVGRYVCLGLGWGG